MRTRLLALARSLAAAVFLLVALMPALARAAGTVTVTDTQPKEEDGRWKLKMTMNYGGTPPTAHVPMLFSFTPTVLYERTLTDQSPNKPVLTKLPLQNQQAINESMDVGFSDASGKIFSITKFDFVIRRDHGFEAGEYTLVIKRSNDDAQMGQQIRLVLQGENTVVDRRAIVFTGKKDEKKDKPDNAAASPDEKKDEAPANSSGDGAAAGEGGENSGETGDTSGPPPVPPKQGGCGCRAAGSEPASGALLLAAAGVLAVTLRRRRAGPPRASRASRADSPPAA